MQNSRTYTAISYSQGLWSWSMLMLRKHYSFLKWSEMGAMHLSNLGTNLSQCSWNALQKIQLLSSKHKLVDLRARLGSQFQNWSACRVKLPEILEGIAVVRLQTPVREGSRYSWYLRSEWISIKCQWQPCDEYSYIAQQAGFKVWELHRLFKNFWWSISGSSRRSSYLWARVPHEKTTHQTLKAAGSDGCYDRRWGQSILALREAKLLHRDGWRRSATVKLPILFFWTLTLMTFQKFFLKAVIAVNNIGRIAPIFFIKTIYSFSWLYHLYVVLSSLTSTICWFSLSSLFKSPWSTNSSKVPTICWPLNAISNRFGYFLRRSLLLALPNALMVVFERCLVYSPLRASHSWSAADMSTSILLLGSSVSYPLSVLAC